MKRTTWIKKMTTKCCLLINVPVPVLLSYFQGILHNYVNSVPSDCVSNKR